MQILNIIILLLLLRLLVERLLRFATRCSGLHALGRLHLDGVIRNATLEIMDTGAFIFRDGKWDV